MSFTGKLFNLFQSFKTILVLSLLVFYVTLSPQISIMEIEIPVNCEEFFFLNAIWISSSNITETLYLESPVNFTLGSTINQTVNTLLTKNVVFNSSANSFEFNITQDAGFYGYIINKVVTCYPRSTWSRSLIYTALSNVSYQPFSSSNIPSEIIDEYVKPQNPAVVNTVVPRFEDWFQQVYGVSVANASVLGLAASAAWFVYMVFIEYEPGAEPRSIEQVIQSRRGDCDDMSRILVELLNYYGVPATIGYGYVYIRDERFSRFVMPVENMTYVFRFNGPHAFALAYIPGVEWISVDWLAGSLWYYPFLFEGESRETVVNESAVEQMLELHRSINGTQLIAVFTQNEFISLFGLEVNVELIENFINQTMLGDTFTSTTVTSIETESSSTTSTITSPEATTTDEQERGGEEGDKRFINAFLIILLATGVVILITIYYLLMRRKQ